MVTPLDEPFLDPLKGILRRAPVKIAQKEAL